MKNNIKTKYLVSAIAASVVGSYAVINNVEVQAATKSAPVNLDAWTDGEVSEHSIKYNTTRESYDPNMVTGRVTSGDYNGDGKESVVAFYDYGNNNTSMHLFEENSTSLLTSWSSLQFNANNITDKVVSGDIDGDGKDEVIAFYNYGNSTTGMFKYDVDENDSTKFNSELAWINDQFDAECIVAVTCGDYNGDGKDEIALFYDYGNNTTKVWMLKEDNGRYKCDLAWESDQFDGQKIKNKVVSGNFGDDVREEIAVFYDKGDTTTETFILKQINELESDMYLAHSSAWKSDQFNAESITSKVVATKNSNGMYDSIYALYSYENETTGIFKWDVTEDFKLDNKKTWESTNYNTRRIDGRVTLSKLDGEAYSLIAMYDGGELELTTLEKMDKVIEEAYSHLGKKYVWGAVGPETFDCSGLTQYVYREALGIHLNRTTYEQVKQGTVVAPVVECLQPGDLVFFQSATAPEHVGIYIGEGQYLHAPQTGDVVKISKLGDGFYNKPLAARRFIN